jgi:hypothetical protein
MTTTTTTRTRTTTTTTTTTLFPVIFTSQFIPSKKTCVTNSILTDIGNVNYILDDRWLKCEARQQVHGHVVFVCRHKM